MKLKTTNLPYFVGRGESKKKKNLLPKIRRDAHVSPGATKLSEASLFISPLLFLGIKTFLRPFTYLLFYHLIKQPVQRAS